MTPPAGSRGPDRADPPADLPAELRPLELLAQDERGESWRVEQDGRPGVLRIGPGALTEVAVALRLGHPSLPSPRAWGRTPAGRPWSLRDWLSGTSFATAARDADPVRVAAWTGRVLGGLAALHAAGYVHRDVKSDNVLVQRGEDAPDVVALLDLDLATRGGRAAARAGTALHLAPEVLQGGLPTPSADLFGLGVMLALCWCGAPRPDFHERFPGVSFWEAAGLDPARVPAPLATLVRALLARDPAARPADAAAARAMLEGLPAEPGGHLGLPFLEGREEALLRLADRSLSAGGLLLVDVDDPPETGPLQSALTLELLLREVDAGRPGDGGPPAAVRVAAWRDDDAQESSLALDALAEHLLATPRARGTLVIVAEPAAAKALLRQQLDDEEHARAQRADWAGVPASVVEQRLLRLGGGAAPADCTALAASLVERTAGSWSRIDAALGGAIAAGVLAPDGTPLQDQWDRGDRGDRRGREPGAAPDGGAAGPAPAAEAEVEALVRAAEEARRHGDAAAARAQLRAARRDPDAAGEDQRARLAAVEARLDLARGQARDVLERLRAAHGADLDEAPRPLAVVAALAAEQLGERELARRLCARLERDGERHGDPLATGFGRLGRAHALLLDGDAEDALALAREADVEGAPSEVRVALRNVAGLACLRLSRGDEAAELFAAARDEAAGADDPAGEGRSELNLAALARERGAQDEAVTRLRRAERRFDRAGHVPGRALALNNLGTLLRDRGEPAPAREALSRAVLLRRRAGDALGAAGSLGNLAFTRLDAGEVGPALALLARADTALAAGGYADERALVALRRAEALALAGRPRRAAALLDAPESETARTRRPLLAARIAGLVAAVSGDVAGARRAWSAALESADGVREPSERPALAGALLVLDPDDAAARAVLQAAVAGDSGEARRSEAAWRLCRRDDELEPATLDAWCTTFERAGRTDLVRAASLAVARLARRTGDAGARRAAAARAARAAEALVDGLDPDDDAAHGAGNEKERSVDRITALAGGPVAAGGAGALDVDWLLQCSRRMASENDLAGLLGTLVDAALELAGARRVLLMLQGDPDLEVELARARGGQAMPEEDANFSRTLVRRALDEGRPLVITDAARDARFASSRSISRLELRSVLCVPFEGADGLRGALYLDDDAEAGMFDETDVAGVRALADQAAIAINNLRRREQVEALNRRLAERVESQKEELVAVRAEWRRRGDVAPVGGLVGDSEAMRAVYRQVESFAPTDLAVLVTGPSGTGKDLVARALHEHGRRCDGPLVVENVAALPAALLESEMFGHVRGAFTGADRDRPGLFAEADGGTFVLDEIGEMPPELQAKLLRVLESGEYRPVGSRRTLRADVRIVAVTNRDLARRVAEGAFREDLYYRLNAAEIRLPPLSERLDDMPLLVRHFVALLDARHGGSKPVDDAVMAAFVRRPWPGNVRELANEVARVYVLSGGALDDPWLVRPPSSVRGAGSGDPMPESLRLEDVERAALERALRASGGRKDRAAELLGISRAGLYAKLKRLGVDGDADDEG